MIRHITDGLPIYVIQKECKAFERYIMLRFMAQRNLVKWWQGQGVREGGMVGWYQAVRVENSQMFTYHSG